jgi:hypothetical protein
MSVWWDDKHVDTRYRLPNHPRQKHMGAIAMRSFSSTVTTNLCLCLCLCLTCARRERLTSCLPFRDTPCIYHSSSSSTTQLNLHTLLYCFHGSFTRPASTLLRRKHITAIYRLLALIQSYCTHSLHLTHSSSFLFSNPLSHTAQPAASC